MSGAYSQALADFEAELIKMEEEREAYAAKPGASPKILAYKAVRLKILRNLQACYHSAMQDLQHETKQMQQDLDQAKTRIFKLEAICVLHGIGPSIFTYLNMPEHTLAMLVKKCISEKWRQTPLELWTETPLELFADYPGPRIPIRAEAPQLGAEKLKAKALREPGLLTEIKTAFPRLFV